MAPIRQLGHSAMQRTSNGLVPIFQKITEVYIAGFVAQDMVGMFGSRVPTALMVGRDEPVDPSQDPELRNKPFPQQIKAWATGNIKSLNWINFKEEFWREVLTGPGLLLGPALIFIAARRLFGKTGAELSAGSLNKFTTHFKSQIGLETSNITEQAYREAFQKHLTKLLTVDHIDVKKINGKDVPFDVKQLSMAEQALPKDLSLSFFNKNSKPATYGEALAQWAKKWSDDVAFATSRKERNTAKEQLSNELNALLNRFNRTYCLKPYAVNAQKEANKLQNTLLHRSQHAWVAFDKDAPQHMSIGSLTDDLARWSDVVKTAWEQKAGKWSQHAMPDVLEAVKDRLLAKKFYLALGTTLATAAYLFRLVFFTQSHDAYAATRLLHEQPGNGAKKSGEACAPQFGSRNGHRSCSNSETPFKAFSPAASTINPVYPPVFSSRFAAERKMP